MNIRFIWCTLYLLMSVFLVVDLTYAQGIGSAGGGGQLKGRAVQKRNINSNIQGLKIKTETTYVNVGTPDIGTVEGIFIWLDENKMWQIRWQGAKGQLIWVRLSADDQINNLIAIGDGFTTEVSGNKTLTITGVTTYNLAGISFKSETPWLDIDAKWNTKRDVTKLWINNSNYIIQSLPVDIQNKVFISNKVNADHVEEQNKTLGGVGYHGSSRAGGGK